MLLLAVSVFTGLTVEGLKALFGDKKNYSSNVLACITSIVLSIVVGICYCVLMGIAFSSQIIICIIALVFLSWLCAMVGYDKVVQSIAQLKTKQ